MPVEKSIDLTATGTSVEDAVAQAISRASLTLRGVSHFEVERIEGRIEDGDILYKVLVRVSFTIREQLHE
jgi:flavin-binding protein dodecin